MAVPDETLGRLRDAAARIAASYGLEIFDVQFRRESIGWVLRVIVDRTSAKAAPAVSRPGPVEGSAEVVSVDDCRRVSEDLSALLDVEDDLTAGVDRTYTLEVSSPGLDRPLRGEADYRRFVGRLAKIVTRQPVDGQSHFAGRLAGVEAGAVLVTEGRRMHRVPLDAISRAKLEVEF